MNWKQLTVLITLVNILAWGLIEFWSYRYAESNIDAAAGFLIFIHLLGYYIIVIASRFKVEPKKEPIIYTPANCPGHDWQPKEHSVAYTEKCVICQAERGVKK